jgi:hypothetical protein
MRKSNVIEQAGILGVKRIHRNNYLNIHLLLYMPITLICIHFDIIVDYMGNSNVIEQAGILGVERIILGE